MATTNATRLAQAEAVVLAVGDTIRELGRVPSGHLYAALMGHMTLDTYQSIIALLKNAGAVREEHHELIWTGPVAQPKEGA